MSSRQASGEERPSVSATQTPPAPATRRSFRVGGCLTFLLFVVISLGFAGMLYHSEQQLVEAEYLQQQTLQRVISVSHPPLPENQNQVVHIFSPSASALQSLKDPQFSVEAPSNSLFLSRVTEYCQWKESAITGSKKKIIKPKMYELVWSPVLLSSELYRDGINHYNPPQNPFPPRTWASDGQLGDYRMLATVVALGVPSQSWYTPRALAEDSDAAKAGFTVQEDYLVMPSSLPRKKHTMCTPGDIRVHYEVFQPQGGLTVVAMQNDTQGTLVPWALDATHQVALVQVGSRSLEEMVAFEYNRSPDWFMRLALFIWSSIMVSAFGKAYTVHWSWLLMIWSVHSTTTFAVISFASLCSYDVGSPSLLYYLALPVALLSNLQLYGALGNKMSFAFVRLTPPRRTAISLTKKDQ